LPIVGWLIVDTQEVSNPEIAPRGAPVEHRQPGTSGRDRLKGLPGQAKPTAVVAVSAGYVLLMGFVFMQAMNGVPLVRM